MSRFALPVLHWTSTLQTQTTNIERELQSNTKASAPKTPTIEQYNQPAPPRSALTTPPPAFPFVSLISRHHSARAHFSTLYYCINVHLCKSSHSLSLFSSLDKSLVCTKFLKIKPNTKKKQCDEGKNGDKKSFYKHILGTFT